MKNLASKTAQVKQRVQIAGVLNLHTLSIACLLVFVPNAQALQMTFPSVPPGSGIREPAPNIILSIDDSGSMGWDVNGCRTADVNNAYYPINQIYHLADSVGCTANTLSTLPSRMDGLKAALRAQFGDGTANSGQVADGRIRLAWQTMNNNAAIAGAGALTPGATNSMKRFSGAHRTHFNSFVNTLAPNKGTPSHKMMSQAYNYMKTGTGINSPWASDPGNLAEPYLSCRRSYHVFMTDGAWNQALTNITYNGNWSDNNTVYTYTDVQTSTSNYSIGNVDGSDITLPSPDASLGITPTPPTSYNGTSTTNDQIRVYSDGFGGAAGSGTPSTIADYAFQSWAEDLQPGIKNEINPKPLIKKTGSEVVGSVTLQEFWNPKNDPATWQHLTTHTIGFGNTAVTWTGAPEWKSTTYPNPDDSTYGGAYSALVNGTVAWQNPLPLTFPTIAPTLPDHNTVRPSELWHAALNGRGKFYPATTNAALASAFADILNNIISDTSKPLISIAASSSTLRTGLNTYVAGYNGERWSGSLAARSIDINTGALSAAEVWNAASQLDTGAYAGASGRFVLSYGTLPTASLAAGFAWDSYAGLPLAQQTPLNKNSSGVVDNKGAERVDYIRGDRTKELSATPPGIYRSRDSRLGDIVNSNIWYIAEPASGYSQNDYANFRIANSNRIPMIYVGANDGMLHGVEAGNEAKAAVSAVTTAPTSPAAPALSARTGGKELLAYIPEGIAQGKLRQLTDANYSHKYYVDGHPFTGDFYNGTVWKTALVGSLAAGGKGYFILDATDPLNFTRANAANLVITDTTASTDADLGYIFSKPVTDSASNVSRQIVKLNNNRWAFVTGNGYNSTNEAPVLIIQYLDGNKAIKKLSPCDIPVTITCAFKGTNGLSAPQLINLNGDGKADIAYAGDIQGNLWKFDLSDVNDSNWKVSFNKQPFFIAKTVATSTVASTKQAITTAPYWLQHPKGGVMVIVGTGRNLTTADQTSTSVDSLYALYDNSAYVTTLPNATNGLTAPVLTITDTTPINTTATVGLPTTLVKQEFEATTLADAGYTYYKQSSNAVDYTGSTSSPAKRGWYINWPVAGQRMLTNIEEFGGTGIYTQTTVPASSDTSGAETCTPQLTLERSFISVFDAVSGKPRAIPAFTLTDTANANVVTTDLTMRESDKPGDAIFVKKGDKLIRTVPCEAGKICTPDSPANTGLYGTMGVRANWREIQ